MRAIRYSSLRYGGGKYPAKHERQEHPIWFILLALTLTALYIVVGATL